MKRITGLALCVLLLCAVLCGCEEEPSMAGTWQTQIELTHAVNDRVTQVDEEFARYLQFSQLSLTLQLELTQEGSYRFTLEPESFRALEEQLYTQISQAVEQVLTDMLAQQESQLTLEEFLDLVELDQQSITDSILANMELSSLVERLEAEGKYHTEEGKLYLSTVLLSQYVGEGYPYSLEGDTLKIGARVADEDQPFVQVMFPMVLTRIAWPETEQ